MTYDGAWFPRIKGDNANLSLRLCPTPSGALRRAFLSGDDRIQYSYPKLYDPEYHRRLRDLDTLKQELELDQDTHPTVVALYLAKVEEKRKYHDLVRAACRAQDETGAGFVAAQQFRQYTEAAFGAPDRNVFNYIVKKIQAELDQATHLAGTPAYERFRERFANPVFTTVPPFPATLVDIERSSSKESEEILSAATIQAHLQAVLQQQGLENWKVSLARYRGKFSVSGVRRTILIPGDRALQARRPERKITWRRLRGIVAHEILTHARRAEAGAQSPLQLLGIGLPGYLAGEEGVAALREQMAVGGDDYMNQDTYFAIGLAYGLDLLREETEQRLRPMREVFDILHDYLTVRYGVGHKSAVQGAFNLCRQIYITSPHYEVPMVLTRHLVYLTGSIAVSNLAVTHPEAQQYFDLGKYDPANQEHVAALATLQLLPESWV